MKYKICDFQSVIFLAIKTNTNYPTPQDNQNINDEVLLNLTPEISFNRTKIIVMNGLIPQPTITKPIENYIQVFAKQAIRIADDPKTYETKRTYFLIYYFTYLLCQIFKKKLKQQYYYKRKICFM